jgi:hypothetical protein
MSARGIGLENRVQSDRRLPPAMKESLGRNVGFVDAGDQVHFGLADVIPVQDWIEDKVRPREHVAACTESKKATHSNIGKDEVPARRLAVQPLNDANPPALRVKDSRATELVILDKDVRLAGLDHPRSRSTSTG